jgi:hypothetical protein
VIAGNKIHHRHVARGRLARPKRANTLQGCGKGNHWPRRKRHDNVSTDRGFIPDLEGGKERTATFAEKSCGDPFGRGDEIIKLYNLASGCISSLRLLP